MRRASAGLGQFNKTLSSSKDVILGPRTHMVLFVQTPYSPQVYLVDAGGGTVGLVKPIPMCDDAIVRGASTPEEHRLVQTASPSSAVVCAEQSPSRTPTDHWQLEIRCGMHIPEWRVLFTFSSQPVDSTTIEAANQLLVGPQGDAAFQNDVFCVKYFRLDLDEPDRMARKVCWPWSGELGRMVLTGGKVTRRIGDRCEVVSTVKTDSERRTVLNDVFGVRLDFSRDAEEHPMWSL